MLWPPKPIRRERHPRHHAGAVVNPLLEKPSPPGPWVDEHYCYACGDSYSRFRSSADFVAASNDLRNEAKDAGDRGGGYHSRGPILWRMRVIKLFDWYTTHLYCEQIPRNQWVIDDGEIELEDELSDAYKELRYYGLKEHALTLFRHLRKLREQRKRRKQLIY